MGSFAGCCDLLSDLFFAIFNNNFFKLIIVGPPVVICFQICSLLYLTTTQALKCNNHGWL